MNWPPPWYEGSSDGYDSPAQESNKSRSVSVEREGEGTQAKRNSGGGRKTKSREANILTRWRATLSTPSLDAIASILLPPDERPMNVRDLLTLWGFLASQTIAPEAVVRDLRSYRQGCLWEGLHAFQPILVDAWSLRRPISMQRLAEAQSNTIAIVERLLVAHKPRRHPIHIPEWLSENGLIHLFQTIERNMLAQRMETEAAMTDPAPIGHAIGDSRSRVTLTEWQQSIIHTIGHLKMRCSRLRDLRGSENAGNEGGDDGEQGTHVAQMAVTLAEPGAPQTGAQEVHKTQQGRRVAELEQATGDDGNGSESSSRGEQQHQRQQQQRRPPQYRQHDHQQALT